MYRGRVRGQPRHLERRGRRRLLEVAPSHIRRTARTIEPRAGETVRGSCHFQETSTAEAGPCCAALLFTATTAVRAGAGATGQQPPQPCPDRRPARPGQPVPGQPLPGAKPPVAAPAPVRHARRARSRRRWALFNTVRPDKVRTSRSRVVRYARRWSRHRPEAAGQAKGWRFFKAAEPGPAQLGALRVHRRSGGAGRGLRHRAASCRGATDTAAAPGDLEALTGSVTGGGTLMNLNLSSRCPRTPARARAAQPGATPVPAPRARPPALRQTTGSLE